MKTIKFAYVEGTFLIDDEKSTREVDCQEAAALVAQANLVPELVEALQECHPIVRAAEKAGYCSAGSLSKLTALLARIEGAAQ